jgi:cytoskeleton protein RodZ
MLSLGEELRREREFREISLREISDATKINMRMLEAIENDNYRLLPGGIFNRNFIRAYASFIGLDPEIAVRKYQVQSSDTLEEHSPDDPVSLLAVKNPVDAQSSTNWLLPIIAGILLLLAGVGFWLYQTKRLPSFFTSPSSHASILLKN